MLEQMFGFIKRSMRGLVLHGVYVIRAKACVAMTNLIYNIARLVQIQSYHPYWITVTE